MSASDHRKTRVGLDEIVIPGSNKGVTRTRLDDIPHASPDGCIVRIGGDEVVIASADKADQTVVRVEVAARNHRPSAIRYVSLAPSNHAEIAAHEVAISA